MSSASLRDTHRAPFKPVLVRLSERERVCLQAIYDLGHAELGYGIYFKTIVEETGLTTAQVRRSVRACARKGLVELHRGLFTDDGMIAGSGYGITLEGHTWIRATTAPETTLGGTEPQSGGVHT